MKNNLSRGFGFVEFKEFDTFTAVIEMKDHMINGKLIELKPITQNSQIFLSNSSNSKLDIKKSSELYLNKKMKKNEKSVSEKESDSNKEENKILSKEAGVKDENSTFLNRISQKSQISVIFKIFIKTFY